MRATQGRREVCSPDKREVVRPREYAFSLVAHDNASLLGMNPGTASSRLKKMVMLDLLRQLGRDICYRCGVKIQKAEELSLDHKKPWRGISADLFWDIENVAFSHRRCNTPDRPSGGSDRRKTGPVGTAWCGGECQAFLPVSEFNKNRGRWTGLKDRCRRCTIAYQSRYYKNPDRPPKRCEVCGTQDDLHPTRRICMTDYRDAQKMKMRAIRGRDKIPS